MVEQETSTMSSQEKFETKGEELLAPHSNPTPSVPPKAPATPSYPPPLVFGINLFALCISVFLVALDNTITSTAVPKITDQFHALDDVGWYGSAYFLTTCAFQLPFGKVYQLFSPKWTFLVSLFIFELGSLICGVAPTSVALIVGRSIAGAGAAGVFTGSLIIIAHTSPMEKRPIWQSALSGMFGISSVIGPLIGGAFTDHVSWRWCFYINLPLGGLTAVIIVFYLHLAPRDTPTKSSTALQMLWKLDPLGFILFLASMVCLFLALQWGGTTYAWNNGRIIALFVIFGLTLLGFAGVQIWLGDAATLPPRIATQRSMWSASWFAFFMTGGFFVLVFFIPIYFQSIKGTTALQSGIDSIPMILANVLAIITSGVAVSKLGYYNPFIIGSVVLTSIGSGLIMTFDPNTTTGKWIGYQILFGLGSGMGFQQPPNAAQAVLSFKDMHTGIAMTLFFRNFGAALFINAGNNMLNSYVLGGLTARALPGVNPEEVVAAGATSYRKFVPSQVLDQVVEVYSNALQKTFRVALIICCLSIVGAMFLEWKSMKTRKTPPKPAENGEAEKA